MNRNNPKNRVDKSLTKLSKFLSLVLRHQPETIDLKLDPQGWADVDDLLIKMNCHGQGISINKDQLEKIVAENDKQRFCFNGDHTRIRANQGHSIAIDLSLSSQTPPELLFHGTATRFLDSIRQQGLLSQSRQYVHLSDKRITAETVGKRHGKPVILEVDSGEMTRQGLDFFLSNNGVWLTKFVPAHYITFPS
ncbi:MAG: RNA 2'-phosphotransferase [Cyanophyceae cyanobacterium]